MATNIDFSGRTALITGAAQGIGAAAARAFAESGANVVVADILPAVEEVAREIRDGGGSASHAVCDVGESASCQALVQQAVEAYGKIDFAFNNAGVGGVSSPLHEMAEDEWDRVIRINLSSVFHCLRYEVAAMLESGGGVIVNTSSICGVRPVKDFAHYVAAKHGIVGLTRQVALEYASRGIRCVAVGPGFIDTAMTQETMRTNPSALQTLKDTIPQARLGQPEDIGNAARMLCSDDAAYINGAYIEVDGGMLLV